MMKDRRADHFSLAHALPNDWDVGITCGSLSLHVFDNFAYLEPREYWLGER